MWMVRRYQLNYNQVVTFLGDDDAWESFFMTKTVIMFAFSYPKDLKLKVKGEEEAGWKIEQFIYRPPIDEWIMIMI